MPVVNFSSLLLKGGEEGREEEEEGGREGVMRVCGIIAMRYDRG